MKINIFGSTGIIGKKSLLILKKYFPDIKINLLVANKNYKLLLSQANIFQPKYIYLNDEKYYEKIKYDLINTKIKILNNKELHTYLRLNYSDLTLLSVAGYESLNFLESILLNTKNLGLVNKECVVSAGHLFKKLIRKYKVKIFPLDSEHYSLHDYFQGNIRKNLYSKIYLTASGGPFFHKKNFNAKKIKLKDAVNHPKWKMGFKNSIDSATLSNKCLEIIEAHYLFDIQFNKLDAIIHPESLIHSIVEFDNFTSIFNYFYPDMFIPIFNFFNKVINKSENKVQIKKFNFITPTNFNFYEIDTNKYPVFKIFNQINKDNPLNLIKFNCANEFAVNLFIKKLINFNQIHEIIHKCMEININSSVNDIGSVIEIQKEYIHKINEHALYDF